MNNISNKFFVHESSYIDDNVVIGDDTKIWHFSHICENVKIGNNVKIGGGSGVIKDIPDNRRVMGYPAKDLKEFIKENK